MTKIVILVDFIQQKNRKNNSCYLSGNIRQQSEENSCVETTDQVAEQDILQNNS